MPDNSQAVWYVSNRYNAQEACEHCEGIIRHEPWCITIDPLVYYAYEIVSNPNKLTVEDALRLHALGVTWGGAACQGNCKANKRSSIDAV
jgi:hypothetical protein